jgi:VanZ family protein
LVALYAGGIAFASSMSHPPVMSSLHFPHVDKLCHFIEFGGLTLLLIRALSLTYATHAPASLAISAAIIVVLYGALDEVHQAFTPNRLMSGYDFMANSTAAGMVAGGWLWARRRWATVVKS